MTAHAKTQPEFMTDVAVAKMLDVSISTVRRWRLLREGPRYLKINSSVRYRLGDVLVWLASLPVGGGQQHATLEQAER